MFLTLLKLVVKKLTLSGCCAARV